MEFIFASDELIPLSAGLLVVSLLALQDFAERGSLQYNVRNLLSQFEILLKELPDRLTVCGPRIFRLRVSCFVWHTSLRCSFTSRLFLFNFLSLSNDILAEADHFAMHKLLQPCKKKIQLVSFNETVLGDTFLS